MYDKTDSRLHGEPPLVVWDGTMDLSGVVDAAEAIVICFGQVENGYSCVDLSALVEDDARLYKTKYLDWLASVRDSYVGSKSVLAHFAINGNFSFWWMSLISEKCNFTKSRYIDTVIKLAAFDSWLQRRDRPKRVVIAVSDAILRDVLVSQFSESVVAAKVVERKPVGARPARSGLRALYWLFWHIKTRWAFTRRSVSRWRNSEKEFTVISYLTRHSRSPLNTYWGEVFDKLNMSNRLKRLYIFSPSSEAFSAELAVETIAQDEALNGGVATSLDSFLSFKVLVLSLYDWGKLRCSRASRFHSVNFPLLGKFNVAPFFLHDWEDSFRGRLALSNCLYFRLFENVFDDIKSSSQILYPQENMDWEHAMLYHWCRHKENRAIGYPHTLIRYWDMRYFFDTAVFRLEYPLFQPTMVGLHSRTAIDNFYQSGSNSSICQVEPLRFSELGHLLKRENFLKSPFKRIGYESILKVVIFGEYDESDTLYVLNVALESLRDFSERCSVSFKPHPAASTKQEIEGVEITRKRSYQLFDECDLIITGSVTTISLEAYCSNTPILVVRNPRQLNLSPLRDLAPELVLSTVEELKLKLQEMQRPSFQFGKRCNIDFYFDPSLRKWKHLLGVEKFVC